MMLSGGTALANRSSFPAKPSSVSPTTYQTIACGSRFGMHLVARAVVSDTAQTSEGGRDYVGDVCGGPGSPCLSATRSGGRRAPAGLAEWDHLAGGPVTPFGSSGSRLGSEHEWWADLPFSRHVL